MGYLKKGASNVLYTEPFLVDIYLSKVNDRNTRKRCEICWKLTIKTPERHPWLLLQNTLNYIFIGGSQEYCKQANLWKAAPKT